MEPQPTSEDPLTRINKAVQSVPGYAYEVGDYSDDIQRYAIELRDNGPELSVTRRLVLVTALQEASGYLVEVCVELKDHADAMAQSADELVTQARSNDTRAKREAGEGQEPVE